MSWLVILITEKKTVKAGPAFITVPLAGLLFFALVSVFFSLDPVLSIYNFSRLVLLSCLYFYLVNEIRSWSTFILPATLIILFQAPIGIAQVLEQQSTGLGWLGELRLNPDWSGISIIAADGARSLRAYGLTDHPNILGGILACSTILVMSWAGIGRRIWNPVIVSITVLGITALLLTFSRSAWLAFGFAVLFTLLLFARTAQKPILKNLLSLVLAVLILLVPFILANSELLGIRLNFGDSFTRVPQEAQSIGERQLLFQAGNQIFGSNPITGIGLSVFPYALSLTYPDFPVEYQPAHFVLLDVAVETGIFGAFFFFVLMVGPWIVLWLNRSSIDFNPSLIGASSLLMVITIIGFFDYYPWLLAPGRFLQWFSWGAWAAIYQSSRR
jgi:hypothetical protein